MARRISLLAILTVLTVGLSAQSAEDYLAQTNQLISEYQWQDALRLLNEAAARYPEHLELRLRHCRLLIRTGHADLAAKLLENLRTLHLNDIELVRSQGKAELALGHYSRAADLFAEALRLNPAAGNILHDLSLTLLMAGKSEEALVTVERAAAAAPNAETRRLFALLLNLNGRLEESDRQMKAALAEEPQNAALLFQISETRRLAGKHGEALEYLDMAVEADPENPLYHTALARLYRRLRAHKLAAEAQERANSLLKAFEVYTESLQLSSKGNLTMAVAVLEPAVQANPVFLTGKLLLADLEARRNNSDRALELYQEALEQDPNRVEARQKSAWIRTQRGDAHSALELLEGYPQTLQNQLLTRAYLHITRGQWQEALEQLQQAELSQPLNHQLLKLMSTCLREQGQTDAALHQLERVRRIKPDDPELDIIAAEIRLDKAVSLLRREDWKGASALFRQLATHNPSRSDYVLNLAYCSERSGDVERAIREYRWGLKLDPQAHWARRNLAACLVYSNRFTEGAAEWERVLRHDRTAEAYLQLGICYANMDRNQEAERVLESARQFGDTSGLLLYNLGVTKIRLFKTDEGWNYVRQASLKGYEPARDLIAKAARR